MTKKDFYIAFFDYEKAFDYTNRAIIINKLMNNGCGYTFTNAIAKMYRTTTYIPMSNNKCTEPLLIYQCQTINVQNHYLYTNVKQ